MHTPRRPIFRRRFIAVLLLLSVALSVPLFVTFFHVAVMDERATLDEMRKENAELGEKLLEWGLRWVGDFWLPGEFERMVDWKMRNEERERGAIPNHSLHPTVDPIYDSSAGER